MEPSSPAGTRMADRVEELVRFTLSSFLDGTLGADLRLSSDYCSLLLQDDAPIDDPRLDNHPSEIDSVSDAFRGVPQYPLYKRLALALDRCLSCGSFLKTSAAVNGIKEVDWKDKELEWSNLIRNSDLPSLYRAAEIEIHVQEPFFSQLRDGTKTVEGRCALGKYTQIKSGDVLLVNKHLLLRVEHIKHYSSFLEMLEQENLDHVLPGIKTVEEGVQVYRKFYSEEKEKSKGVLGISVSRPAFQPWMAMGALISGLGYEGIGCLLGMAHTVGTAPESLSPPRSALLSSFSLSHGPDGSPLTEGARALSKHVGRSSSGWWGSLTGNDSEKNRSALSVVDRLMNGCCWMNSHVTKTLEHVFEVRVGEGYGARWSADGSKFIGFLEPYTEDGQARRWRH